MCGFVGFWSPKNSWSSEELASFTQIMTTQLSHRGPDGEGTWVDEHQGIALGHRRLSIQDVSEAGAQPMISTSGRFVVIYNGEIYNAPELKAQLRASGVHFRSHSDTEVLLAAWEQWGPLRACQKFAGMFAFALWDRQESRLFLVRDRLGVKPLYWGFQGQTLFFGSTFQGFKGHPEWDPVLDKESLALFLRLGYIPTPKSIFQGMHKLFQGTIAEIKGNQVTITPYWSLPFSPSVRKESSEVLLEELSTLLDQAIHSRLLSDVPLGAFLSGGIDSSLVVALMQKFISQPVKTFSIGFEEAGFNEAPHAAAIARHLGTDHHEMIFSPHDVKALVPDIPRWYDEPFADSSQLPTYLVSRLARRYVTVSLSGDGGDELFAGYNRYRLSQRLGSFIKAIPLGVRSAMAWALHKIPSNLWDFFHFPVHKMEKIQRLLRSTHASNCYEMMITHWDQCLVQGLTKDPWPGYFATLLQPSWTLAEEPQPPSSHPKDLIRSFQWMDMKSYLPDDILVKVDRASMAVGLEAREPLLDHRLIEFAWSLPTSFKIQHHTTKWPLRQILYKYVPSSLIERPKMGFGIPLGQWMRGPLRQWASDLLSDSVFHKYPLLDKNPIQQRLHDHLTYQQDWGYSLWNVLMLHSWLEQYKPRLP